MKHIVVFASGSGTNFQALIDAVESGQVDADIRGLICNKQEAKALKRARRQQIESIVLSQTDFENNESYTDKLEEQLLAWETDLIVLAGYLIKVPERIISRFRNRIINIHPSLLPKYGGKGYYGKKVHKAVIENGEKESGCTVHMVTEEYDEGPILAQEKVPVYPSDDVESLAKRVLKKEHLLLPEVTSELIESLKSKKNNPVSLKPLSELPEHSLSINRALLSVSDKTGLIPLAEALHDNGVELISTGGTAEKIRERGLPVTGVSEVTGFEECLDGRVKTLHPSIHGALLARTSYQPDVKELHKRGITPIELAVVNLYPFRETAADPECTPAVATEHIDIGGPTMIRAAAKNFAHVCVLTSPDQYPAFIDEFKRKKNIDFETRRKLAQEAFNHTAGYDCRIANYFNHLTKDENPFQLNMALPKFRELRYGENPHQHAAVYGSQDEFIDCFHGKQLSYNNLLDVDAALNLISDFEGDEPACAILKHTVPCGVAIGKTLKGAWEKAFATDTLSPFGGIVVVNRELDPDTAHAIDEMFTEIIIAPSYNRKSLSLLKKKKNRRLIRIKKTVAGKDDREFRSIFGGALSQQADRSEIDFDQFETVSNRKPTKKEIRDLLFSWRVVKHVKSNGIVYARNGQTIGIGTGQTSRVEASEIAIRKAENEGLSLDNTAIASDAFFPFADGVEAAAEAGATCVIQPGGSIRDEEVIEAADDHNLAMVFTGRRHFRH